MIISQQRFGELREDELCSTLRAKGADYGGEAKH